MVGFGSGVSKTTKNPNFSLEHSKNPSNKLRSVNEHPPPPPPPLSPPFTRLITDQRARSCGNKGRPVAARERTNSSTPARLAAAAREIAVQLFDKKKSRSAPGGRMQEVVETLGDGTGSYEGLVRAVERCQDRSVPPRELLMCLVR